MFLPTTSHFWYAFIFLFRRRYPVDTRRHFNVYKRLYDVVVVQTPDRRCNAVVCLLGSKIQVSQIFYVKKWKSRYICAPCQQFVNFSEAFWAQLFDRTLRSIKRGFVDQTNKIDYLLHFEKPSPVATFLSFKLCVLDIP